MQHRVGKVDTFSLHLDAVRSWVQHSGLRGGADTDDETTILQSATTRNPPLTVHYPDGPLKVSFTRLRSAIAIGVDLCEVFV